MARKVQVILEDDLDGTELGTDGETVTFALDGTAYEIDLSDKNAKALRDSFSRYVERARKAGRAAASGTGHSSRRGTTGGRGSDETKAARAWLIEQGILTADSRGRISQDNWEKYHARNQQTIPASGKANGTAATAEAAETATTPDKAPRGNSQKAEKAAAKDKGTADASTSAVASLLP